MEEEGEYISKIVLELQPRSLRGYRRLFGIRENKFFKKELFDRNHFTNLFLNQYNSKSIRRGEHIKCCNLIVAVKQIKSAPMKLLGNTQVEFRLRGLPFFKNEEILENKGRLNKTFISDIITKTNEASIDIEIKQNYPCYCCECKKSLSPGEYYIKTGNWSRPIVCVSCYELLFTHQCVRCSKSITFDHNSITSDGLAYINYAEHNGLYWHSDCCVCVICLTSLVGKEFCQDQFKNQLFCHEHDPEQF
ncbi:unnamed protein product [Adineta steineri]|uniref:LIM zinc-binding domain-containing protein n=1 Tax=Adineta steineri TaxID=433720 RepID=A0A818WIE9_9BILA|nr:unnamed protein product [Adineta steineri]CAF3725897.1 unnamed protein product [Adineta steineri]